MKILVRGDHPILKRPDKIFVGSDAPERAKSYFNELVEAGYENLEIKPFGMKLGEKQKQCLNR